MSEGQGMVRLGDIEVGFNERGDALPVVLVHGLAEDHRHFARTQAELADFHTYAYDLRGHGETSLGEADGTLAQLAGDLVRFLERLTGPARCVGFSLGGTVVFEAAATRPDLVIHAVVAATSTVVGRTAARFFSDRIELIENDFSAYPQAQRRDAALQLVSAEVDLDAVVDALRVAPVGDGGGYINAARAMLGMHAEPLTPKLAEIRCPVDVVGGDSDVFCPKKAADIMLDALADATYHEIADCGHWMPVDQPVAYASALGTALRRRLE